ncbi:MAG: TPM domain-containing protein [Spirochaetaceae bacterium]|nr:TPM domain-containing protein [Spirochaetaceae bacterium]
MKKGFFAGFFLLIFITASFPIQIPKLQGYVNDYAGIISPEHQERITETLAALENQTGTQIFVLTMPSLDGNDLTDFSFSVAESWQIGQAGKDNGALLLVSMAERKIRIEVGYGLEGLLTDAKCGLIIRNILTPAFRNNDYSRGIFQGVSTMAEVAGGDDSAVAKIREQENADAGFGDVAAIIIMMIFWFLIVASRGRFWLFPMFFSHGGYGFGGGYSDRGGFRGGFGGGGGGSFGGGGASGGW